MLTRCFNAALQPAQPVPEFIETAAFKHFLEASGFPATGSYEDGTSRDSASVSTSDAGGDGAIISTSALLDILTSKGMISNDLKPVTPETATCFVYHSDCEMAREISRPKARKSGGGPRAHSVVSRWGPPFATCVPPRVEPGAEEQVTSSQSGVDKEGSSGSFSDCEDSDTTLSRKGDDFLVFLAHFDAKGDWRDGRDRLIDRGGPWWDRGRTEPKVEHTDDELAQEGCYTSSSAANDHAPSSFLRPRTESGGRDDFGWLGSTHGISLRSSTQGIGAVPVGYKEDWKRQGSSWRWRFRSDSG